MAAPDSFKVPNPRGSHRPSGAASPGVVGAVVVFLCAPAVLGLSGYGYLRATDQMLRFTPGELPRVVARTLPAPAIPVARPVPRPPRPAPSAAPPPAVREAKRAVPNPPAPAQATARQAKDGHFYFDTLVNGSPVPMLFDTGASAVVLRWEDAQSAGVDLASLEFRIRSNTANGVAEAAFVMLGAFRVGGILRSDVPAVVLRKGKLAQSLLGQSFMSRLAGYQYDGDQLVLRGK